MKEEIIRKYAELMKELELTALEISEDGSIRLERSNPVSGVVSAVPAAAAAPQAPAATPESEGSSGYEKITSPMIGVFYQAPAENAEPFVRKGDRVSKGDTLCIIEAMKLMNEVTAERDCVIKEVCGSNGDTVEFGTVLFLIGE